MGILELKDVGLELGGKQILKDLSMDLWEGHVHAIVGPNGAGKSTLACTIMGLAGYQHFTGDILFQGKSLKGLTIDQRAKLGITMAWQEPARYEGLSVAKFISAGIEDSSQAIIKEVLEKVRLDPEQYMTRAVDSTLSGGERKKLELASILAMKPKLVMLDEPDSGIDVASLNNIFEAIKMLKEDGASVLLITHSEAVLAHAEHAFLLCCGTIRGKGSIERMKAYFGQKCVPCDHKNQPLPDLENDIFSWEAVNE